MRVLTFGEMLMRLTSNATTRLHQSNIFTYYYGGAEANVAISLANFGLDTTYVTKLPEQAIGHACMHYLRSHQVDTKEIVLGGDRLGIYFVEAGIGNRQSQVTYDRKYSSFQQIKKEELDWERILDNVDIFHTTGITLALSEELQDITVIAMQKAKEKGIKVSFDFNFRAKLWKQYDASVAIKKVLPYVDIAFCNHMDAMYLLNMKEIDVESHEEILKHYYKQINEQYPSISIFASTKRNVLTSSKHELEGYVYHNGKLSKTSMYTIDPVIDRIGGGDAYAAGILYGYSQQWEMKRIVSFATAASVLKHTIEGDGNAFSVEEVEKFIQSNNKEISR